MKKPLLLLVASSFLTAFLSSCGSGKSYAVSFSSGEGYSVSGDSRAKEGEKYVFTVSYEEGYEASASFSVKANDVTLYENGGHYVVENVTSDLNITVSGVEKITYSVSFYPSTGVSFTGEDSVSYGSSYSFKAVAQEGYDGNPSVYYVMGGGETTKMSFSSSGLYSIPEVKGNLVISAEELSLKDFAVTSPETSDKYEFSGPSKVTYGSDYVFTLSPKEGYDFSSVSAYESETTLREAESLGKNQYKITSVKGNLRLVVNGVGTKIFTINKDFETEHYSFKGEEKVAYGEDYTFSLSLKEGYSKGANYGFLVNGEDPEETNDGKYIIRNVRSAPRIEAFGEEIITLNIAYTCNKSGALKKISDKIPYFQNEYRFTIELDEHYDRSADSSLVYLVVDDEKTLLAKNEDGTYSVANPHKDFTISVEGVDLNSYMVAFYNGSAKVYEAKVYDGSSLSDAQLSEAKAAFESSLGEDEKLDEWDNDLSSVSSDMSVHGKIMKGIGDAASLAKMENDGSYYLKSDIALSSPLNISSFSGKLNGLGHRIYSGETSMYLLYSGDNRAGVLFDSFSGTLIDLKLEVGISDYSMALSGIARTMEEGLIENVEARVTYRNQMFDLCGGLVGTLNGGTIKDSSIQFVAQNFDNSTSGSYTSNIYPLAATINGGSVENVTTYVPCDVEIAKLSLVKTGMNNERVKNCPIKKKQTKKADSAIVNGTLSTSTLFGMPLYEGSYSNGSVGTPLFNAYSLADEKIDTISFFVKVKSYVFSSTKATEETIGLDGMSTLRLYNSEHEGVDYDIWNYIELHQISSGVYRVSFIAFVNSSYPSGMYVKSDVKRKTISSTETLQSLCGKFYSWNSESQITLLATPLYVSEK